MATKAEARLPERRSLEEIASVAPSATQARLMAIKEGYTDRQSRKCSTIWTSNHKKGDAMNMSGIKTLIAILCIGIATLAGCGQYKDGQYNDWKDDLNSGGDAGRALRGKDKPNAKGPVAPKPTATAPAPVVQFFGAEGRPGFWSDGQLALQTGSRHIFVNENQSGLAGMLGTMAIIVSGVNNGQPIAVAPTANFAGWYDRIYTNAEIPDSVRTIRAVKVDANGVVIAEADKTYTVRFEGEQFFEGDSEQLGGVPNGAGSIYFDRFNAATSTLYLRTAGRKIQVLGSSDDGKPHILGNEDVNGWSSLALTDVNGNPVTSGKYAALLLELNTDGTVKGLLDVSKAKFAADIPVTGSSVTKKGIAFFIEKGVVYLNPTAAATITVPALQSLTTTPVKATIPVGETFTFDDVLGVFAGGYRTSVRYSTEMVGISSLTGVASVSSALSRKGESAATASQTVQIGAIVSAPATELTVFEAFLELSASPSQIVSGGKTEIKAVLHKRGEQPRDVSRLSATTFVSDKSAFLAMSGNIGTGGSQGNPVVTVTFEGTTKTIVIQVLPKPRLIEARIPKTTFVPGEEFTPELIVIAEGAFTPENKASSAKWTSSSAAVAITVADGGKTTTQLGGGKAKLTASYLGLTVETEEFTVTPVPAAPKVTSITPASLAVTFKNTDAAQIVGVTVGKSNGTTGQPATGVTVKSAPDYVTATMDTSDANNIKVAISAKANRSGSGGSVILTHADGVDSQPIAVTLNSVLASISQPSNLTLQVNTPSQLAGLTGTQNNSANTGGATSAALGFDKVTSASTNVAVAAMNATGLVTAGATVGTATITLTSVDVPSVTRTFTVTTSLTAPPPTVTSITPASLAVTFKNTDAAQIVGVTVGKSNGTTGQPATGVTVKSAPDYVTATMDTSDANNIKVSIAAKANRSGSGGSVILTHADGVDSQPIAVTLNSVLASISQPSNLTLQVNTPSQLAGLTGTENNSANSGGATSAALAFNKVTFSSSNASVAGVNATGLVTAGATVGTATITITSVDVPSVTRTFTVTTTLPPGGSLGDSFTSSLPTYRAQVLANNGDGTSRVRHYLNTARLAGLKDKPKAMMTRPDRQFQFTIVTLSATETAPDGSTWWFWDVNDTFTSGERFLLNLFNGDSTATATNWAVISGSGVYNFTDSNSNGVRDGAEPDALTPIVNPTAGTVTKGSM